MRSVRVLGQCLAKCTAADFWNEPTKYWYSPTNIKNYISDPWGNIFTIKYTNLSHYDKYNRQMQWRTQEFCLGGGGVQQIQLRAEDRENGDLGLVAP